MNPTDHHLLRINRNWRELAQWALGLGVAILTIGLIGSFLNTASDRHALTQARAALHAALQAERNSVRANQLSAVIQAERYRTTLQNCRDQNSKHDNTIRELDQELQHSRLPAPTKARQRYYTVLLINRLDPVHDCRAAARAAVR